MMERNDPATGEFQVDDERDRVAHLLSDLGEARPAPDEIPAEIERLYLLARDLLRTLEMDDLIPRILDMAISMTGAERGAFFHFDSTTGDAQPLATRRIGSDVLEEARLFSRTILDEARAGRTALAQDGVAEPRCHDIPSLRLDEIRSVLCVPVGNEERILGALYLDDRGTGRRFNELSVRVVTILASLSAVAVQNAERFGELARRNEELAGQVARYSRDEAIVGRSRSMIELLHRLDRVTNAEFPVLILGESGSGKELVCRAIHQGGRRAGGPFIVQNCAAIPGELLESEFFGHDRGAFTGAHVSRDGLFRRANGGTLFLDEIAEMDLRLQAKLLRVLEEGVVRPVGGEVDVPVDFRLVTATSVNMQRAVDEGRVRRDLYYRLNVVVIQVPPLRERPGDIPLLLDHFLRKYRGVAGERELRFSRRALDRLQQLPWPGNVRELEHLVQRALVLIEAPVVQEDDIPRLLDPVAPAGEGPTAGEVLSLAVMEEQAIREALKRTGGNKSQAAQLLGIHRNALLRRLDKLRER